MRKSIYYLYKFAFDSKYQGRHFEAIINLKVQVIHDIGYDYGK